MMRTRARFPDVPVKAGHYESFYLKLARPEGGLGAWIRHTVHKRPGERPTGSVWFTLFDAEADGPKAAKATFDESELESGEDLYIRVDGAGLEPERAIGSVKAAEIEADWHLLFEDEQEPFFHLPAAFLYRTPLPKTKFLSPYPNCRYEGWVSVAGNKIEISGWPGMIGHNWGAEHAERWVWVQGAGFEGGAEGDYFDFAVGRIKIGRWTTPWVGNAQLVLDGVAHRLGGLDRIRSTEVRETPTRCEFELSGKGIKVKGRVGSEPKNFVAWIYADPVGPEHNTLNCSISDLELMVEQKGSSPRTLIAAGTAAYEVGTRDTDHGIPVQPYPDG
jgi:hypothetical protein